MRFTVVDWKIAKEIRDILKRIDQNISHLLEQNRVNKCMFRCREDEDLGGDRDDGETI